MPLTEYRGNLFNSSAQTLVNTVNCVGVMGKGVALEFRRRFPGMFQAYARVCREKKLKPGMILPHRESRPWVFNFAVKDDWKQPSRLEWVDSCMRRFADNYRRFGVTSIAFPWMGAMNGGLPWEEVHALMRSYLEPLEDIDVEIVEFDPDAPDSVYARLRDAARAMDSGEFAKVADVTPRAARAVCEAILNDVPSLARLSEIPGLGKTTMDRLYAAFRDQPEFLPASAPTLFD